eukprot:m.183830 g.183830  ORF g.183830 m.183830 type:complete len:297 (-) comp53509_c0_seq1:260-1150(-)
MLQRPPTALRCCSTCWSTASRSIRRVASLFPATPPFSMATGLLPNQIAYCDVSCLCRQVLMSASCRTLNPQVFKALGLTRSRLVEPFLRVASYTFMGGVLSLVGGFHAVRPPIEAVNRAQDALRLVATNAVSHSFGFGVLICFTCCSAFNVWMKLSRSYETGEVVDRPGHALDVLGRGFIGLVIPTIFVGTIGIRSRHIFEQSVVLSGATQLICGFLGYLGVALLLRRTQLSHSNLQAAGEMTPLHLAAIFGHQEAAELLIKYGAKKDARTAYDKTPVELARAAGAAQAIEELLSK